jgi:hypothetical protein
VAAVAAGAVWAQSAGPRRTAAARERAVRGRRRERGVVFMNRSYERSRIRSRQTLYLGVEGWAKVLLS